MAFPTDSNKTIMVDDSNTVVNPTSTISVPVSLIIGTASSITGLNSVTTGKDNTSTGNYSFISGDSNTSSGSRSATIGLQNTNHGLQSIVAGWKNTSGVDTDNMHGNDSIICGDSNSNTGNDSIVGGTSNTNTGGDSIVGGIQNTNSTGCSITVGSYLNSGVENSANFGICNEPSDSEGNYYIFTVGNGIATANDDDTYDFNRSNALSLDGNGNLEVAGDIENGTGNKLNDLNNKAGLDEDNVFTGANSINQVLTRETTINGTATASQRILEADGSDGTAITSYEASYNSTDGNQGRLFAFGSSGSDGTSLDICENGYVKVTNGYFATKTVNTNTTSATATIATLNGNNVYKYGTLTSLTITSVEDSVYESEIYFTSGTSPTTFTYPDSLGTIGEITINASKRYVIAIKNNIMILGELN